MVINKTTYGLVLDVDNDGRSYTWKIEGSLTKLHTIDGEEGNILIILY